MIKSKEMIGPSCLTSAQDDEPIFVLKSTDELAPEIVRQWAGAYWRSKGWDAGISDKQRAKHAEALDLANQMEKWRSERRNEQS